MSSKPKRSKFSGACLLAAGVSVIGGAIYTARAVQNGEPFMAMLYLAIGIVIAVYYIGLFCWSQGYKFVPDET